MHCLFDDAGGISENWSFQFWSCQAGRMEYTRGSAQQVHLLRVTALSARDLSRQGPE
jgi:hypothetical protein